MVEMPLGLFILIKHYEREEIKDKFKLMDILESTEEQRILQRDYFRITLLEYEIEENGKAFELALKDKDILKCFRLLKNAFTSYSILFDNLKHLGTYCKTNQEIALLLKDLRTKLELMNHLRNKMSGHLDDEIIDKAIQWQPTLFSQSSFDDNNVLPVCYFGLFEASLNSFMDTDGKQKYFNHEIDVCYPSDWKEFSTFIYETYSLSLEYLSKIKGIILPKLELAQTEEELLLKAIWAGNTDFSISKKRH